MTMRTKRLFAALALGAICVSPAGAQEVLPRPDQPFKGKIGRTARESTPDFPKPIEAPKGAPNVLLILTDDVGFGAPSTFGGAIPTPTFDRLAKAGLRYNTFHTTALCSPTRAALITGRNHHTNAHRRHHGNGHGLPRLQLADVEELRHRRGDAQAERLQHLVVRQEPQRARLADEPGGAVRPLAHRPWLRVFLRLHRRRHRPVALRPSSMARTRSRRRSSRPASPRTSTS